MGRFATRSDVQVGDSIQVFGRWFEVIRINEYTVSTPPEEGEKRNTRYPYRLIDAIERRGVRIWSLSGR